MKNSAAGGACAPEYVCVPCGVPKVVRRKNQKTHRMFCYPDNMEAMMGMANKPSHHKYCC